MADDSAINEINTENLDLRPSKKKGRKTPKKKKGYFYENEEDAFRTYVETDDKYVKDAIFRENLYPAFTKMIESIIRRYNLFTPEEDFYDTFYDTLSFLLTKVDNFDFSKGKKVYSYCGTICKNFLIQKRMKYVRNLNKLIPYESVFNDAHPDDRIVDDSKLDTIEFNERLIKKATDAIKNMIERKEEFSLTENEISVGNAIIIMLENWDEIFHMIETQKFNKTAVLYFIKEYTRLSTKEVRDAMHIFKDLYFIVKEEMVNSKTEL